ncbi:unnamed protein product [Calypogeia fissa]
MLYTKGLCQVLWEPRTWVALKSQAGRSTISSARSYTGLGLIELKGRSLSPSSVPLRSNSTVLGNGNMARSEQKQLKCKGVKTFASLAAGQETVARTPSEVEITTVAEDEQVPVVVLPTNQSSDKLLRNSAYQCSCDGHGGSEAVSKRTGYHRALD